MQKLARYNDEKKDKIKTAHKKSEKLKSGKRIAVNRFRNLGK